MHRHIATGRHLFLKAMDSSRYPVLRGTQGSEGFTDFPKDSSTPPPSLQQHLTRSLLRTPRPTTPSPAPTLTLRATGLQARLTEAGDCSHPPLHCQQRCSVADGSWHAFCRLALMEPGVARHSGAESEATNEAMSRGPLWLRGLQGGYINCPLRPVK